MSRLQKERSSAAFQSTFGSCDTPDNIGASTLDAFVPSSIGGPASGLAFSIVLLVATFGKVWHKLPVRIFEIVTHVFDFHTGAWNDGCCGLAEAGADKHRGGEANGNDEVKGNGHDGLP